MWWPPGKAVESPQYLNPEESIVSAPTALNFGNNDDDDDLLAEQLQ